ncbi:hypothetical protein A0J61_00481 [Choanephora cucurbitarum]|uniref:Uncharacterized protein n=1 Tax=Choanephora cucurbitarum TaxID=101091 RepID=A0A1C7NQT1_9FUNG|nr:hypothetical protein A0J61_00481 [Choanephora cucurbitarum]
MKTLFIFSHSQVGFFLPPPKYTWHHLKKQNQVEETLTFIVIVINAPSQTSLISPLRSQITNMVAQKITREEKKKQQQL